MQSEVERQVSLENDPNKSSQEIPQLLGESELRNIILDKLSMLDDESKKTIINAFVDYRLNIDATLILEKVAEFIKSAARDKEWGSINDSHFSITIGYYQTNSEFFTIILHELGHSVLKSLGRTTAEYLADESKEEDFCWQFSASMCQLLNLSYSLDNERVYRQFCEVKASGHDISPAERLLFERNILKLIIWERDVLGFSSWAGDTFHWNEQGFPSGD